MRELIVPIVLAQGPATPAQRKVLGGTVTLALVVIVVAAVLGGMLLVWMSRYRQRVLNPRRRARSRPAMDAWREAGRRATPEPPPEPGADDDTVDLDPGDGPSRGKGPHG